MNPEDFFNDLENDRPFLKCGFMGFAGSGKTFTAVSLAIGLHKAIGSKKPIVAIDTEKALAALKHRFSDEGISVKIRKSKTLADLVTTFELAEGFTDILLVDSVTHVWERFLEDYKNSKKYNKDFLEFQDWGKIKPRWKKDFSDRLVNSPLHIIFCGRSGHQYEDEKDERGKRQIYKSGTKMRAETETAYEPDVLVEMEQVTIYDEKGKPVEVYREAFIRKDRSTKIDCKRFKNPTFEDFKPAVEVLLDGKFKDGHESEQLTTFDGGNYTYDTTKKEREILLEKITGTFTQLIPGKTKDENKAKVDILETIFKTKSWKEVEGLGPHILRERLQILEDLLSEVVQRVEQDVPVKVEELAGIGVDIVAKYEELPI